MALHPVLKRSALFRSMTDEEIIACLRAMETRERTFEKGETILPFGVPTSRMCLVMTGSVSLETTDDREEKAVLTTVETGRFFAEPYAIAENEPLPFTATANEKSRILFFRVNAIYEPGHSNAAWLAKFTRNLLEIFAREDIALSVRLIHTRPKTIRGRVLSYLRSVAAKKQTDTFEIPFDRQGLADHLNVERSALSKELSKMQAEGLIETKKNRFVIHDHKAE